MTKKVIEARKSGLWSILDGDKDIRHTEWLINHYHFYVTQDGYAIELWLINPSIDKTIYYNDETCPPVITEDNFVNYNIENNFNIFFDKNEDYFLCQCNLSNEKRVTVSLDGMRRITKIEKDEISEILKKSKKQYIKRLKNCYNRSRKNIRTVGYFANR